VKRSTRQQEITAAYGTSEGKKEIPEKLDFRYGVRTEPKSRAA